MVIHTRWYLLQSKCNSQERSFIDDGYIYVTPTGGSKQTLLRFYTKSKDMSDKTPTLWYWKDVDGAMVLSRDQDYEDVMVTTTTTQCEVPSVPGQEYFKVYITWTVPASLRGKEFTISWKIHKKGNGPKGPAGESTDDISIKSSTWFFPDIPELIKPTLMEPSPTLTYGLNSRKTMNRIQVMMSQIMAMSQVSSDRLAWVEP